MKEKFFLLGFCVLFFSVQAYSIQEMVSFVIMSDGRGWWPYACVTENGAKDICECGRFMNDLNYSSETIDFDMSKASNDSAECMNKCFYNFCGARECPFGPGVAGPDNIRNMQPCAPSATGPFTFDPYATGVVSDITVDADVQLVKTDGSVVGDELCLYDEFTYQRGTASGEYWWDGGFYDSPPVQWVDDVKVVAKKLLDYHAQAMADDGFVYNSNHEVPDNRMGSDQMQTYNDPLTGLDVYSHPIYQVLAKWEDLPGGNPKGKITGALVCSIGGANLSESSSIVQNGEKFKVMKPGDLEFTLNYPVECMYYYYGRYDPVDYDTKPKFYKDDHYYTYKLPTIVYRITDYGGYTVGRMYFGQNVRYNSVDDFFTVGSIGVDKKIHVVDPPKPVVEVSIAGGDDIKTGVPSTLRVLVKNTGNVDVSLKSVHSTPAGQFISCDSGVLHSGDVGECLITVTPEAGKGLSVEVSYDYMACGRSQVGLVTKAVIDSKIIHPVLKEESYLMGVHGACDNSYYSCHSASEGSLFAGYKCYKTASGFFAPATERFNLRFDLSEIPKNGTVLGAKLYLKASDVGGKQAVNVYSVNKIPEVVKCLPGGDICTKPYCGECKPLYDLDGTVASSVEISSAGQYSFDVTNSMKDKLAGGGIVSLQVRGAEGLWESLGQSSCTVENDWDKRDVSFDAGGRDGPYLEVVYK